MIKQPDLRSKILSIVILFFLLCAFGLSAYLPSTLEGEITKTDFTISQSLAYSIKPLFVVLLTIAIVLLSYLMYYRGHNYLYIRLFLLSIIYSFVITIVWITTMYNETDHYILAMLIFTTVCIFISLNSLVIFKELQNQKLKTILIIMPILAFIGIIGVIIGYIYSKKVSEIFPAFENYMLVIKGLSILTLGFM